MPAHGTHLAAGCPDLRPMAFAHQEAEDSMRTRSSRRSPGLRLLLPLAAGLLAVGSAPAHAEIEGFTLLGLDSNDVTLEDRIGPYQGDTEHVINIEDCEKYLGNELDLEFSILVSDISLDYQYGVAYSSDVGGECATTSVTLEGQDDKDCFVHTASADYTDGKTIAVSVDFERLIGKSCSTDTKSTSKVYVVLDATDAIVEHALEVEQIDFTIDLEPPSAPELLSLSPGDGRIEVAWEDTHNEQTGTTYRVYWSTESVPESPGSSISSSGIVSDLNYEIEDSTLVNGVTYYVRVAAIDDADNEGPLSNELSEAPVETTDFWEAYLAAGGTEQGGFCFIATAAYGTPMAGDLDTLRAFRDQILLPTTAGAAFVDGYYRWGRFAAAFIAGSPVLRAATRVALVPLVWLARASTTATWPALLLWALALALGLAVARRAMAGVLWRGVPGEVRR